MRKWLRWARRQAGPTGILPSSEVEIADTVALEADPKNVVLSLYFPNLKQAHRSMWERDEVTKVRDALDCWLKTGKLT